MYIIAVFFKGITVFQFLASLLTLYHNIQNIYSKIVIFQTLSISSFKIVCDDKIKLKT